MAGLLRVVLAVGAVPLLIAPTCGTMAPGLKSFARRSLIIPMDACYQHSFDTLKPASGAGYLPTSCPQAKDNGDVIRAYGLVYQLVRNNIAVYWVIDPAKTATTGVDLSVQYNGGPPAYLYDWAGGGASLSVPTTGSKIDYRGGPFIVDGTDYDRAVAVLNAYRTTFQNVNVHVSNVAFQGEVAKTMAGGWSAGGTVPPKLALLDIGSDGAGSKNSEPVIRGYLERAGLNTPGAAGTASGTHGQIYDRLVMEDFLPSTPGDWRTTRLYQNGYQILWVPHWVAPNSCSDCVGVGDTTCPCDRKYGATTVAQALATIGAFHASGKDVFAECAGLGSFEGVFGDEHSDSYGGTDWPGTGGWDTRYRSGHAATHFQTLAPEGFWINLWPVDRYERDVHSQAATIRTGFSSPLTQVGDFTFVALSGAVGNYRANAYKAGVTRFITYDTDPNYDIFTMIPPTGGRGTAVYLAGHSYSGTDGSFEVAGSRLVLNTLFNLGASCQETGVACNTGGLGECAQGVMSCTAQGQPYCRPLRTAAPTETCDGRDNNCNGLVDENLDVACYDGPPNTRSVGTCQDGVSSCVRRADGSYGMSECRNDVLPSTEICNGLNDDCDRDSNGVQLVDENTTNSGQLQTGCYTGPASSLDPATGNPRGTCKAGISACQNGVWSECAVCPGDAWRDRENAPAYCQILPRPQTCSEDTMNLDVACTGAIACTGCTNGATQPCYYGPTGTAGVGICSAGTRLCANGSWGECQGGQTPLSRDCSSHLDNDCNGALDDTEAECITCPAPGTEPRICRVPGIARVGGSPTGAPTPGSTCEDGERACTQGVLGECSGMVYPAAELCDAKDNDCDGSIDENPETLCAPEYTCTNGVCVQAQCGVENPCRSGFACNVATGACELASCGAAPCAAGQVCEFDVQCKDPCSGVVCGEGASCSSGTCAGGGCYLAGCATGQVCQQGHCVPDPCSDVACPVGTFCRAGDCVQSCVYVSCPNGQICGADGFCEEDACARVSCSSQPGTICKAGACVPDACTTRVCGPRQTCDDGVCEDDPCNATTCPVGACSNGQCFPAMERDHSAGSSTSSGGCDSGQPGGLSALLLLGLLPLLRRRAAPAKVRTRGAGRRATLLGLCLLAAGAAACSKGSSTVDLSTCTHVCEGEDRCIDLAFDPGHCGGCDISCGSGQICRDGVCGPSTAVAPRIRSISPDEANHGRLTPLTVTLTGERFSLGENTTVRVTAPGGSRTYRAEGICPQGATRPCPVVSPTSLLFDVELADMPITVLGVRVVNADRVISNAVPFDVTSVAPSLTDVTPANVNTGSRTTLHVTGTGFSSGSVCHLAEACRDAATDFGLPTTSDGSSGLNCVLDAAGLQPRTYSLWVVNDGTMASTCRDIAVVSATPTLVSLSPSSGQTNAPVDLVVTGTGFDTTSTVVFAPLGTSDAPLTTYVDATRLLVSQLLLRADGQYTVTVRNGTRISNALTYTSLGSPPLVTGLSLNPTRPYQGESITLSFGGTSLGNANQITIVPPTGASWTVPATANATLVTGTASLVGRPDGLYDAYLGFTGGGTSSTFSFRVFSNVAVLRSVSPAGGQQGNTVNATLTASNIRGAGTATLRGPIGSATPATRTVTVTSPTATTVAAALNLGVAGTLPSLETGVYALSLTNPGAAASNEVSFSVLPGFPTLTSLSATCVLQREAPYTITLRGTNFARPDVNGNAVSQLMFSPDAGATWYPAPATVTVTDSTTMSAVFDTRNAVADTNYQVSVWNPSTSGALMKSGTATLRIASTACP